jgi:hypothetical protein
MTGHIGFSPEKSEPSLVPGRLNYNAGFKVSFFPMIGLATSVSLSGTIRYILYESRRSVTIAVLERALG